MNFSEIFKRSFLEGYASNEISPKYVLVALAVTCIISAYIFLIYRLMTKRTFYSLSFNISLVCTAIITAAIIFTIQSNVVISLGMVGALSIVRFRTAIKDPMDLVFLFWAISTGIICGAGLAEIAIITSLILTAAILVLSKLPVANSPMLLIVNASDPDLEARIVEIIGKYAKHFKIKSRNITGKSLDLVIEVRVREEAELVKSIAELANVTSASLLSHDGDATF